MRLEKLLEFVHAQTSLTDNFAQRAAIKFFMIRNNNLPKRFITAKNHVTALS